MDHHHYTSQVAITPKPYGGTEFGVERLDRRASGVAGLMLQRLQGGKIVVRRIEGMRVSHRGWRGPVRLQDDAEHQNPDSYPYR
jgi:hypothetical protein